MESLAEVIKAIALEPRPLDPTMAVPLSVGAAVDSQLPQPPRLVSLKAGKEAAAAAKKVEKEAAAAAKKVEKEAAAAAKKVEKEAAAAAKKVEKEAAAAAKKAEKADKAKKEAAAAAKKVERAEKAEKELARTKVEAVRETERRTEYRRPRGPCPLSCGCGCGGCGGGGGGGCSCLREDGSFTLPLPHIVGAVAGAPSGQPPAPWRSLIDIRETRELHNQLAHEIRQRQQREGLVVVPWESVSFDKILDKGAFSTVAKAKLNMTPCAVKMNDVLSSHGVIEALALLDECSMMAIIHHPNIVKTLGIAFDAPAKIGLIMELMNCSLHELMHAHAFSFRELQRYVNWADSLLAIATDIAIGMTYLHYRHIIHRDLKPLNVLMTDGWTAKVADFGEVSLIKGARDAQHDAGVRAAPTNTWRSRFLSALASEASGGVSDLSSLDATEDQAGLKSAPQLVASKLTLRTDKSGVVRIHGTLSYLSPEAASVDIPTAPRVGTPTDVWSFGCLLAHCAARAPPYTDVKCQSAHEVIRQLRDGRAKPLSMVVEGDNMPALLMAIARECTCVAPEQRPTFAQISARLTDPNLIRVVCFEGMRMDEEDLDLDLDLDPDPDADLEARRPPFNLSTPEKWTKEADCPKLSPGFTLKIPKSRFPGPKPPVVQPFPGPNPDFVKKGLHGIGIGFPEVCTDPEGDTEPRVGYVNSLVAHVQRIVGVHAATAGDTR
eukprot:jgi/Chrpa1/2911/Chrysochromulina_OHIO_Genome00010372-RA